MSSGGKTPTLVATAGSRVAMTAARQVKPVIMELGGKSPQIVLPDADLELTANGVAAGIFPPSGQSCIAGSRLIVHRSLHDQLVERLSTIVGQARFGDPSDPNTHIGPIAHKTHFDCILADIERAKAEGATLALGGKALESASTIEGGKVFLAEWQRFMARYGMRGRSEIDIARPRWQEDASSLLSMSVYFM